MTSPPSPDITVVVIAQMAEKTLDKALRSLVGQAPGYTCEIVVVAHFHPGFDPKIAESPAVKVIRTPSRLSPGAARNIGVREASGKVIAFLAADCVAEPGWIEQRVLLHRRGIPAVASAVTNASPRTIPGWASHYSLFPSRLPGREAGFVTHLDPAAHGLSYERDLLSALGPFAEDVRIGEDSDMAARAAETGATIWFEPSVKTAHHAPANLSGMIRDHYRRGLRSGASAVLTGSRARPGTGVNPWSGLWLKRVRTVLRRAWTHGRGERWRILFVSPWILLAITSYQLGWGRSIRSPELGREPILDGTSEEDRSTSVTASVVILFRYDGSVLTRAIEGLRAQIVDFAFEMIVVDSSPDGGAGSFLGGEVAGPWDRLELIRSPIGLAPGGARNRGIEAARGEYIAFLAADCIPSPLWLAKRVQRHRQGFQAVAGAIECAPPRGLPQIVQWLVRFGRAYPGRWPRTTRLPRFGWSYSRLRLDDDFREDLAASEDRVFNEELLAAGAMVIFDPAIRIAHIGLTSFAQVWAHQRHHGATAAKLAENRGTEHLVSRYGGRGFRFWYPPLRWLRGLASAAAAGPRIFVLYLITAPWQLAAYRAWAEGFISTLRSAGGIRRDRNSGWIIEQFGRGGIARYAVDVANLLGNERAVHVATTTGGGAQGLQAPHQAEPWFPSRRRGMLDRIRAALIGLIRAVTRPRSGDWAWIQLGIRPAFELALVAVLRLRRVRVVCTIHNRAPHERKRPSRIVVAAARRCRKVIVHNRPMSQWGKGLELPVVYLPFPIPDVTHSGAAGKHTRSSLGLDDSDVIVLSFGNLRPYKGIDALIRGLAAAIIADPQSPVKLVIAGQAGTSLDPQTLAVAVGVHDRVRRIAGYLEDGEIVDLLALADAAAFPYMRVDHSGSAVLAAANGLPAIVSDLPILRELFDGRGIFVTPGRISELAEGLVSLPSFVAARRYDANEHDHSVDVAPAYRSLAETLWVP